jgi:hypothetical protein
MGDDISTDSLDGDEETMMGTPGQVQTDPDIGDDDGDELLGEDEENHVNELLQNLLGAAPGDDEYPEGIEEPSDLPAHKRALKSAHRKLTKRIANRAGRKPASKRSRRS